MFIKCVKYTQCHVTPPNDFSPGSQRIAPTFTLFILYFKWITLFQKPTKNIRGHNDRYIKPVECHALAHL